MARIPIIRVIGEKGSGKTKLIAQVTSELVRRGYRVCVIKHTMHPSSFDQPGKDTWRFSKAGARICVLCGPYEIVIVKRTKEQPTLKEVVNQIDEDVDIMLVEGFRNEKGPRIEVRRHGEIVSDAKGLISVVGNPDMRVHVPQFGFREITSLVNLLEAKYLARRAETKRAASNRQPKGIYP